MPRPRQLQIVTNTPSLWTGTDPLSGRLVTVTAIDGVPAECSIELLGELSYTSSETDLQGRTIRNFVSTFQPGDRLVQVAMTGEGPDLTGTIMSRGGEITA